MNLGSLSRIVAFLPLFGACAHRAGLVRSIDVQGQCFREVSPDKSRIDLSHVVLAKDIETASRLVGDSYSKLKNGIESLKLKDLELKTTNYSVQERREWVKDRQVSRGYEARMSLQVSSSEIARMGEILQVAGRESVQEVGSLQTFISTSRRELERGECLKQAVLDARAKALGMAETLGAKVGSVLRIAEEGAASLPQTFARPEMAREAMMMKSMGEAPEVSGGKEELRYGVNASFELR